MLNEDISGAPRLAEARYREANESHPEHVHVRFDIERGPGMHLLDKATQLLHSSDYLVGGVIDGLATEHLRNATGTTASIGEDGYAVFITANVPPERADPAAFSGHTAARAAVSLTPGQAAVLPAIEEALTEVLPSSRRHHSGALAERFAKELPTRDQVTEAYHRPTLDEVIDKYAEQYDPDGRFLMPKSLRTVALSYPHNATAAPAAAAPAAAANGAAQRPAISAGYGR
ncbi:MULTISPECIES: hypothetical protein [Paenarthrobacter]|uniref:hypothetical protein n=1 Tax=Paenarthrobacter TaxID=1742992 RepID=UPI001FB371C3|nr:MULTISPECIES: hypothetical protein [Paenarthrobacter]MCW3767796.1 hypothetical protein [Paenarthrobacter sp. PAE-2]UOD83394.1 hypothetical protein MQZ73_20595 [Paenarthrobacter ureafaciens]WNZ05118.1 hypothetical protein PVT25_06170 [Paenarthrobacter ureafaciens]WOC63266.1 hypothetical protein RI444_22230 [Paenarthrobacter sp. AT5]